MKNKIFFSLGVLMTLALWIYRDAGNLLVGIFLFLAQWILIIGIIYDNQEST